MNRWFWKSRLVPAVFFVVVPAYVIGFVYFLNDYVATMMPSVMITPLVFNSLSIIPSMMVDAKRNSLIEKAFIFARRPICANVLAACYSFCLVLGGFIWDAFLVYLVSFDKQTFPDGLFTYVDWGTFVFGALLGALLATAIVVCVYTFVNSRIAVGAITMLLMVFSMLFSGISIPVSTINTVPGLNYVSYFSPFRYVGSMLVVSMNANNPVTNPNNVHLFDFGKDFLTYGLNDASGSLELTTYALYRSYDLALNIFVPLILVIVLLGASLNVRIGRRK